MTEAEAEAALAEIALELVAVTDRLQRIHDEVPVSPDREAMWAHEIPSDVATEVYASSRPCSWTRSGRRSSTSRRRRG